MRGWRYVGRVGDPGESVLATVPPDSIIALSAYPDGPLRIGTMRARDSAWPSQYYHWLITSACADDYVFVATAIGEHVFTRPSAPTPYR